MALRVIISLAILLSGNFGYGFLHSKCITFQDIHFKCDSICCSGGEFCDLENFILEKLADGSDCCEVHQGETLILAEATKPFNSQDKTNKSSLQTRDGYKFSPYSFEYNSSGKEFSETALYLSISCLRI